MLSIVFYKIFLLNIFFLKRSSFEKALVQAWELSINVKTRPKAVFLAFLVPWLIYVKLTFTKNVNLSILHNFCLKPFLLMRTSFKQALSHDRVMLQVSIINVIRTLLLSGWSYVKYSCTKNVNYRILHNFSLNYFFLKCSSFEKSLVQTWELPIHVKTKLKVVFCAFLVPLLIYVKLTLTKNVKHSNLHNFFLKLFLLMRTSFE